MSDHEVGPFEPPEGQDNEAPDLDLLLVVLLVLLKDIRHGFDDPETHDDLRLRIRAIARVINRVQEARNGR